MVPGIVVQRAAPADVKRLGEMLDTVYRPQLTPGDGMPKEFPHLFHPENAKNLYYVEIDGKPVSMVAVKRQHVVFQGITMEVASIGSVVTLPSYQGRQISSAILDQIIQDLTSESVPLMLVSGDRGLYRRIHCIPVGNMFEAAVDGSADDSLCGVNRVEEIQEHKRAAFAANLGQLYRAEASRYRRTDTEMATLVNALWSKRTGYSQRLFVIYADDTDVERERVLPAGDRKIAAYVVAYQAASSPDHVDVFEWAGSRSAFVQSLPDIRKAFSGAAQVRFHVHRTDFTMQSILRQLSVSMQQVPLQGTIRILDVQAFFSALEPVFVERYGVGAELEQNGASWTIHLDDKHLTTESLEDLLSFVFDDGEGKLGIEFVHTDDLNYI